MIVVDLGNLKVSTDKQESREVVSPSVSAALCLSEFYVIILLNVKLLIF